MKELFKNIFVVILFFFLLSAIFSLIPFNPPKEKQTSFAQLVDDIKNEKVKKIVITGNDLEINYFDNSQAHLKKEPEAAFSQTLFNYGVDKEKLAKIKDIEYREPKNISSWLLPILWILPTIIILLLFWSIFQQAKGGTNQIFNFTKANARLFGTEKTKEKITFKDIAGLKEAKEELMEIVDFLKNPKKYLLLGAKIPKGALLIGAPGTGKTMLAKAVANEGGVPFFSISGSEFVEMFVGVGAARIRSLFEQAQKLGKGIIFIDEIDSIGKIRTVGVGGGHEEREQTLNQLLAEMDGIKKDEEIIIMGATNKPEVLDPALLRPGRFDRRIILDLPDVNEREEILKIHCRGKPLNSNVILKEIAERTAGFSGADLANITNEAALLAARGNKKEISQIELLEAIEKVLLGPERKSHLLGAKEKEIAAYHEAGHAIVSSYMPHSDPVRKISIISRGLAAGYTLHSPKEEKRLKLKSEFIAELATLLGGYCAEEIKFKEITTGSANDLEKASEIAGKLVKEFGMSTFGPLTFGRRERLAFLDVDEERRNYSEKIAAKIDKEIETFIKNAYKTAKNILIKKWKIVEKLFNVLMEKETIEREELEKILKQNNSGQKTTIKLKIKNIN